MSDWHPCLPGHVFDSGGLCGRCGLLDRDKATDPKAEYSILRKSDHAALIEAANKQPPAGKWRYIRMNQPAPEGDDFVVIAAAEYEAWRLRFKKDRDDQDAALRDAIAENVVLRAELDQAAGVIADRNKEIADLVHDLDFAKSATGEACATVAQLAAELEEATQARGRLRLWLEFIHLNSNDAKEFTAEALIGNHVPEGFEV